MAHEFGLDGAPGLVQPEWNGPVQRQDAEKQGQQSYLARISNEPVECIRVCIRESGLEYVRNQQHYGAGYRQGEGERCQLAPRVKELLGPEQCCHNTH